jgi:hypothetical protein
MIGSSDNFWVRVDTIDDVLSSLELVAFLAPLVDNKPSYWKWIIVSAHSALQGAMVCALVDSTNTDISVLSAKSAKKVVAWHNAEIETRGEYPDERLADFSELLDRCINTDHSEPLLVLTPDALEDIRWLHGQFRNNFLHFRPQGWSIEKAGLPRFIRVALDAVERLMTRSTMVARQSEKQCEGLAKALHGCRAYFASP